MVVKIDVEVGADYVKINGATVPRPVYRSRSRWLTFWKHLVVQGITAKNLEEMEKFMRGTESNFNKVGDFHKKFGLPYHPTDQPMILDDETFLFRYHLILEETVELLHAHRAKDLVQCADAIADLLYVVYGLANYMHLPIDMVFDVVHEANMKKERAKGADDSRGKRHSSIDVVKPEGWQPPDLSWLRRNS